LQKIKRNIPKDNAIQAATFKKKPVVVRPRDGEAVAVFARFDRFRANDFLEISRRHFSNKTFDRRCATGTVVDRRRENNNRVAGARKKCKNGGGRRRLGPECDRETEKRRHTQRF